MSKVETTAGTGLMEEPLRAVPLWRRVGIYAFMVVWAVCGLAWTDLYPAHSVVVWQLTTIVFAGIAIWRVYVDGGEHRVVLALKQVAHWGAFLGAMALMHTHFVADMVTGDVLGIVTLSILAFATFLDGIYVDWRFCLVGAMLGLGVLLLAWLNEASLGLVAVGVVVLAILYLLRHFTMKRVEAV